MSRPARARINLQALQHNFSLVQHAAPDSQVMAIVKANAYGHGLISIAQALPAAAAFGVSCLDEAIALREAGFDRRIVLLEGLFGPDDIGLVSGYRLDVVVHHASQLQWLAQGQLLRPLDVWLKIDTGMHRLGFEPDSVRDISSRLQQIPQVETVRYITIFPAPMTSTIPTPASRSMSSGVRSRQWLANSHWQIRRLSWVGRQRVLTGYARHHALWQLTAARTYCRIAWPAAGHDAQHPADRHQCAQAG